MAVPLFLGGCANFGPNRLSEDQLGYSRALSEGQKSQTLLNIVQLRYADAPVFLKTTQLISGHQFQGTATGGFELFPTSSISSFLSGAAGIQLQQTPTFTFQPVTGQEFVQSFIRPLSPAELLPLSLSGLHIDILFRLAVRSIGNLQNISALDSPSRDGTPGFFELLLNLRRLQAANLLDVRQDLSSGVPNRTETKLGGHLMLGLQDSRDPALQRVAVQTRRLLGMPSGEKEAEIVYGHAAPNSAQVAMLTRPILGVLAQVSADIEVPEEDVHRGSTVDSVAVAQILHRPAVIVHSGRAKPAKAFAAVEYRKNWFWIDEDDFDSKIAFTVVQLLLALSQVTSPPGAILAIPTR